jgi:PAS domain S-box-containing protein
VEDVIAANQRALLTLIVVTSLIALLGFALIWFYARRLAAPLANLTDTALNISRGDLDTPVPVPTAPLEIARLAAAFEESRVNTRRYLDILSQEKAWSETLIQSVSEGIVTIDKAGQITSFNQGAAAMMGWERTEVLGMPADRVFRLPGGGSFLEHIPSPEGMQPITVFNYSGREITLAVSVARLNPPNEESVQTAVVLRDITEEEAAQQLRRYFLANISHEFRTPLSALNASVELLLDDIHDLAREEIARLLNSIHFSVAGLQTLIDNLLESTSIEAGRFRIRRRPTHLRTIFDEATRVMKPLLSRRQQTLRLNIPEECPTIRVDPTRLIQVLVNLLSNASKYSPMGETIDLKLICIAERQLRVSVADRGPGVPPAERQNLFRSFMRLGDQGEAQYGIGLGLWVVKTIIEEHGGQVGVDERPGGGSVFWFTLPFDGEIR